MPLGTLLSGLLTVGMRVLAWVVALAGPGMSTEGRQTGVSAWLRHLVTLTAQALSWVPGVGGGRALVDTDMRVSVQYPPLSWLATRPWASPAPPARSPGLMSRPLSPRRSSTSAAPWVPAGSAAPRAVGAPALGAVFGLGWTPMPGADVDRSDRPGCRDPGGRR